MSKFLLKDVFRVEKKNGLSNSMIFTLNQVFHQHLGCYYNITLFSIRKLGWLGKIATKSGTTSGNCSQEASWSDVIKLHGSPKNSFLLVIFGPHTFEALLCAKSCSSSHGWTREVRPP